jgi:HTH-type transcriptional regulator/antitoxin HipB
MTPYGYLNLVTPYSDSALMTLYGDILPGRVMQVTTVHHIQALVRGRRRDLGLSQELVARSAGVSRKWLSEFERGTTTAVELPLVLRVLAALGLAVEIGANKAGSPEQSMRLEQGGDLDLDNILRDYSSRDHR